MIHKFFRFLLPAIAAFCLTACETTPYVLPKLQVYTTQYADAFRMNPRKAQSFKPGETVAVVVNIPRGCGYGEKVGTVIVRNKVTGAGVSSKLQSMREGRDYAFKQENLAPGSYLAEVNCDGTIESTCAFEVR
jgi:hypothetical protein